MTKTMRLLCSPSCLAALLVPCGVVAQTNNAGVLQSLRQELDSLRQRTQALEQKLAELESSQTTQPPAMVAAPATAALAPAAPPLLTSWSPTEPISVARSGQACLNLSFGALTAVGGSSAADVTEDLELGHHDPSGNGFTLQCAEIALDGAVDPYFRGFGNICLGLEADGHTHVGLEEAYGGLMWGVFNGQGDSAFSFRASDVEATHGRTPLDRGLRGPDDLLYVPRLASLNRKARCGQVKFSNREWTPMNANTPTRLSSVGIRVHWRPFAVPRGRGLASLATSFVQYIFDDGEQSGPEHSIWLQGECLLGARGAHKFQPLPRPCILRSPKQRHRP